MHPEAAITKQKSKRYLETPIISNKEQRVYHEMPINCKCFFVIFLLNTDVLCLLVDIAKEKQH